MPRGSEGAGGREGPACGLRRGPARGATLGRFPGAWRPRGAALRCGFEGRGLVFRRGEEERREVCAGTRGDPSEVGTPPPPRWGSPWASAVTVPARLPGAERLRRLGRWRELRRGEQLGLRRHKAGPVGPCGLHGGCTEAGLIRGTRPSELITGPGFPALPATIPPGRGAETLAAAGRGRVAPGGARACLGPGLLAWGLHCPSGAAQNAGGWYACSPSGPPPRQRPRGKPLNASSAPRKQGAGVRWGLGKRLSACARRWCAPAQPVPHPGSQLTLVY